MCKTLKEKHDALLENLNDVNLAHERVTTEGLKLNDRLDYHLCRMISVESLDGIFPSYVDHPVEAEGGDDEDNEPMLIAPDGPSMKIFYKNLRRISKGDWWIFPDPDSMDMYKQKVKKPGSYSLSLDDDIAYFSSIVYSLTYDLFSFLEYFEEEARPSAMSLIIANSRFIQAHETTGAVMPFQRFMYVYQEWCRSVLYPADTFNRKRIQNHTKMEACVSLRENFHK